MLAVRNMFSSLAPVANRTRTANVDAAREDWATQLSARGERIAIVDDEEVMVSVARSVLKKLGYATSTYESAGRFLNDYRAQPDDVDLVITDVVMPGITGPQLAKQLRDAGHTVPILLMTGFGVQPKLELGAAAGRVSFVRKPFSAVQLAQAVRRLLSN